MVSFPKYEALPKTNRGYSENDSVLGGNHYRLMAYFGLSYLTEQIKECVSKNICLQSWLTY